MARWISEFAEYDLDIRYQKKKDAIVPDALNQRPDFISNRLANKAEKIWLSFQKINEHLWYDVIMAYLKNGIILDDKKVWKLIQVEKDHFKLERDTITDKP